MERCTLKTGEYTPEQAPAVYVVIDGKGEITWKNGSRLLKKGDYFFLPYSAGGSVRISTDDRLQWVSCLPPQNG